MSLIVPMLTRGALNRNDLLNNFGTTAFIQPPINDMNGLMNRPTMGMMGAGMMGGGMPGMGMGGSMMGGGMGVPGINSGTVGGFVAGAAVGAVAMNAMQNGGLNGVNSIDHPQRNNMPAGGNNNGQPQNNYPNNGYNNAQPQNNYPNNGYNNAQPQNNFPNNGYNNAQPQNNFPNNGYNNGQPQNNFPNNGYNNAQPQNNFPNNGYNNGQPQNPGQNSWEPVRNTPSSGQGSGNNFGVQQPVNTAPAAYASNPQQARPTIKRNRVQPTGDRLAKGQKYSIKDREGRPANELKICLGWDIKDGRCELDASAFMLADNGKVPGDEWFIFYGQPDSPDNGVHYKVFKDDPSSPDDAAIELDLDRIDQRVQKIELAVTIYEASQNALHFGMVKDLYARILDKRTNREIASFKMDECYSTVTAMVLGELYRYKGEWKFNAVGSGVNKDLSEFCGMYGVALE